MLELHLVIQIIKVNLKQNFTLAVIVQNAPCTLLCILWLIILITMRAAFSCCSSGIIYVLLKLGSKTLICKAINNCALLKYISFIKLYLSRAPWFEFYRKHQSNVSH